MRWTVLLFSLTLVALAVADDETTELPLAESCDEETCELPNCRCSSTNIPGGLQARDTPQFAVWSNLGDRILSFSITDHNAIDVAVVDVRDYLKRQNKFVTLTLDDAVNVLNIETYRKLIYNRFNSNGCAAGTTFYVNHEYTNYQLVNELYNNGFEIALHSISHRIPQTYWAEATYETMVEEIAEQKVQMSHFANIPYEAIKGVRIPFLQLAGNNSFLMMADHDLLYDSSWPTTAYTNPGIWPYTLDHTSTQDCVIPPCPTASIPGPWVMPMIAWTDLIGLPCSMVDACFAFPDREDEEAWFNFILTNFERHYLGNRAPFGFYVHEWYLTAYPAVYNALSRFLDLVNNLPDAFMVNSADVIDWVKDPVPINEYREKACNTFISTTCPATSCGPIASEHNTMSYWMQLCNACPRIYPWVGNPLGL